MLVAFLSYAREDLTFAGPLVTRCRRRAGDRLGPPSAGRHPEADPVYLAPSSCLRTARWPARPTQGTWNVLTTIDSVLGIQILPGGIELARLQAA